MKSWSKIVMLFCAASLGACGAPTPRVTSNPPLLAPATLGRTVYAQQQLEAEFKGQSWQMQGALEVTDKQLRMVGLTPYGQRLITLLWDGAQLQETRDTHLPDSVQGARILSDLQLIYWSLPSLQQTLPAQWRVEQQARLRQVWESGQLVIRIECAQDDPWQGRCVFEHVRDGYRLTLDSQPN